jgi:hypothetical protein
MPHEASRATTAGVVGPRAARAYAQAIEHILEDRPQFSAKEIRAAIELHVLRKAEGTRTSPWKVLRSSISRFLRELRSVDPAADASDEAVASDSRKVMLIARCGQNGQWHWRLVAILSVFEHWDEFTATVQLLRTGDLESVKT